MFKRLSDPFAGRDSVGLAAELQIAPLRYPGFPVEFRGVDELHAGLSTESRTRGRR